MKQLNNFSPRFCLLTVLILTLAFSISCNKKEVDEIEEEDVPTDFVDQPLSGKISNGDWSPLTMFSWVDENYPNTITIQMSNQFFEDPCSNWSIDGKAITIRVGDEVDLYEIENVFFGDHEFSILDSDLDFWENAIEAKVDIQSISLEEISGRLYAYHDDSNYMTGNFTVTFQCDY